ncbi:hypothetical protein E2F47_07355 [Mycobacterium eburneum]|nr:hypothetical protein E2F47_07355 [Mycobacterium eburneum]
MAETGEEFTGDKGRPPPGGEEARVVVHQPRGVGLIHPRTRPSNAHYTHDNAGERKYCLPQIARRTGAAGRSARPSTPTVNCHFLHNVATRDAAALCWIGDRLRLGRPAAKPLASTGNHRCADPHGRLFRS